MRSERKTRTRGRRAAREDARAPVEALAPVQAPEQGGAVRDADGHGAELGVRGAAVVRRVRRVPAAQRGRLEERALAFEAVARERLRRRVGQVAVRRRDERELGVARGRVEQRRERDLAIGREGLRTAVAPAAVREVGLDPAAEVADVARGEDRRAGLRRRRARAVDAPEPLLRVAAVGRAAAVAAAVEPELRPQARLGLPQLRVAVVEPGVAHLGQAPRRERQRRLAVVRDEQVEHAARRRALRGAEPPPVRVEAVGLYVVREAGPQAARDARVGRPKGHETIEAAAREGRRRRAGRAARVAAFEARRRARVVAGPGGDDGGDQHEALKGGDHHIVSRAAPGEVPGGFKDDFKLRDGASTWRVVITKRVAIGIVPATELLIMRGGVAARWASSCRGPRCRGGPRRRARGASRRRRSGARPGPWARGRRRGARGPPWPAPRRASGRARSSR